MGAEWENKFASEWKSIGIDRWLSMTNAGTGRKSESDNAQRNQRSPRNIFIVQSMRQSIVMYPTRTRLTVLTLKD